MDVRPPDYKRCISVKSKKNITDQCNYKATRGDFCTRHTTSRIVWTNSPVYSFTQKKKSARDILYRFWITYGRPYMRRQMGPCTLLPEIAENESDLLTLQPVEEIPFVYRFSYIELNHAWLFDIRFLIKLMSYGEVLKNPFTQSPLTQEILQIFKNRFEFLRFRGISILYVEDGELSAEQIWNQKVLDVFLKMNSLGFAVNILWFDMMTETTHRRFYKLLFNLWTYHLALSEEQKEIMVPGHSSGRSPLFRWTPEIITVIPQGIKWWRKQTLTLMKAFLFREQDPITQSSNVITVLTALANCHRHVAEAFPWLIIDP
jgi:hypothetical protein